MQASGILTVSVSYPNGYTRGRVGTISFYTPANSTLARLVLKLEGHSVSADIVRGMLVEAGDKYFSVKWR